LCVVREFLPNPEKRFVLVCEFFDTDVVTDVMEKFDRLNLVIVVCPGFRQDQTNIFDELATLTCAKILTNDTFDKMELSPFGHAEKVDITEHNVVTFTSGDDVVVIDNNSEVMVIHETEEGEENDDERLARLACESDTEPCEH